MGRLQPAPTAGTLTSALRSNRFVCEEVGIETIRPTNRAQRRHPERKIARLMGAITKFGQLPILVNAAGVILDGHAVYEASRRLGMLTVAVIRIEGLSQLEQRALMLALNKLSEDARWDLEIVGEDIRALVLDPSIDFSIDITGFDQVFVDGVMMGGESASHDDIPDPPAAPVTRPGDVWTARGHRIICGDSTRPETLAALMLGELARMILGDFPYNVPIRHNVSGLGRVRHDEFAMASGEMSRSEFVQFQATVMALCRACTLPGGLHYYFIDWRHVRDQIEAGEGVFGELKQLVVWAKDNAGMGAFYRSRHELLTIWKVGDAPHVNNFGLGETGRYRSNMWEYPGYSSLGKGREQALSWHPTVKPLAMIVDAILDVTRRDDVVLDPFCGSGTTLIACQRTGRCARLIEIEPKYVDVTLQRFIAETGEEPVLEATGELFSAVQTRREAEAAELDWDLI